MISTTEPIPVMVRRFECPHCARRRASKAATRQHMARCWYDPANKTCKTCTHFEPVDCCGAPDLYSCYTPMCPTAPTCAAGVDLGTTWPVVGCDRWTAMPTDRTEV